MSFSLNGKTVNESNGGLQFVTDWYWLITLALVPAFLFPGWWSWVVLGCLALLWILRWRVSGCFWRYTLLDWPVVIILLGVIIGLLASLDFTLSANRAWSLVAGLTVYYAAVISLPPARASLWGGPGLVLAGVGIGLFSLLFTDWGRGDLLKIPFVYDRLPHLGGIDTSFGSGSSSEQEINPRVIAGALAMLVPVAWTSTLVLLRIC